MRQESALEPLLLNTGVRGIGRPLEQNISYDFSGSVSNTKKDSIVWTRPGMHARAGSSLTN